jgi:hypothetical protein
LRCGKSGPSPGARQSRRDSEHPIAGPSAALGKLHTVTGNLFVVSNDMLPRSEVEAFGARVQIGGEKTLGLVR